uniref:SS18 N-terminal domain-containing protein n=1 Tax=Hyaloperonospora arabidopsidis (strain Emoy2) TaxID=559515 RepID=M4BMY0_HYAAE
MTSGARWRPPSTTAAADDESHSASSPISDVFTDMLNVNEDLIVATAECQADGDVEGLLAYHRILHRDLMEMAEFIDSMYGVYSNIRTSSYGVSNSTKKSDDPEFNVVDLTIEDVEDKATPALAVEKSLVSAEEKGTKREQLQRGALLAAIEAGEKERETQRSKEQWIKSRHQVLEEESVSAIMKENTIGMLEVANVQSGGSEVQQGGGGLALVNQLRAHQQVTAFLQAAKETAGAGPLTPMHMLLAQKLAIPTGPPHLAVPAQGLPVAAPAAVEKQIKPSVGGTSIAKLPLPPAHSMVNKLYPFSETMPLLFYPQPPAVYMSMSPWQSQLHLALPARTAVLTRPPAKKPEFKRMCESCRKRHFSVRQCRLVLQHTDPEWQPAKSPADRRRRRK